MQATVAVPTAGLAANAEHAKGCGGGKVRVATDSEGPMMEVSIALPVSLLLVVTDTGQNT